MIRQRVRGVILGYLGSLSLGQVLQVAGLSIQLIAPMISTIDNIHTCVYTHALTPIYIYVSFVLASH